MERKKQMDRLKLRTKIESQELFKYNTFLAQDKFRIFKKKI